MLPVPLLGPTDITRIVAANLRERRLEQNLSQEGLAARSGVTLGSLKRFERTGAISFESLVRLAQVLDAADDIAALFRRKTIRNLDEIISKPPARARGRLR